MFLPSHLRLPHALISAYIADLQPQGWLVGVDGAGPEGFGFCSVDGGEAISVDFEFAVGVPWVCR